MAYFVTTRWGVTEQEPNSDRLREVIAELDAEDSEHPEVSLSHESEWTLAAFPTGLLVWENVADGEPSHMRNVSRERVLELWLKLAQGDVQSIQSEPWLPGYGSDD